jgi:hypothetical protein
LKKNPEKSRKQAMITPVLPLPARQCTTTTCELCFNQLSIVKHSVHAISTGGEWWSGNPSSTTLEPREEEGYVRSLRLRTKYFSVWRLSKNTESSCKELRQNDSAPVAG